MRKRLYANFTLLPHVIFRCATLQIEAYFAIWTLQNRLFIDV